MARTQEIKVSNYMIQVVEDKTELEITIDFAGLMNQPQVKLYKQTNSKNQND